MGKSWGVVAALALTGQWVICHAVGVGLPTPWNALLPGLGIVGAAFLLSWAAELAQLEIPQALALAILALIAVLPEYTVDMYFAWTAGRDPHYISFATANMTGGNRLLIGLGWPVVYLVYRLKTRRPQMVLSSAQGVEIAALLAATVYSFIIPWKGTLSLLDTAVLLGLFSVYLVGASRGAQVEPELAGPAASMARWPLGRRRLTMVSLFLLSGYTIFIAAKPFAEGLLTIGRVWGVEEFVLIQWLAPLASESPEFIVAILFAWQGSAGASLGTLVSSKVNQWTLLVGMLPLAYCLSAGRLAAMALDARQMEEILLTSAQSLFAVSVLANFRFELWEAVLLLGLFATQLLLPSPTVRYGYSVVYLMLTVIWLLSRRERRQAVGQLFLTVREVFRRP